jgi:chromosome segregation ATPase
MGTAESRREALLGRVERLERRDRENRAHILDNKQRLNRIENSHRSLQEVFRSLKGDVAAVSASADDAEERLDELEGRIERIEGESWIAQYGWDR